VPSGAPGNGYSYLDFWNTTNSYLDYSTGINWGGKSKGTSYFCESGIDPTSPGAKNCIYAYPDPRKAYHTVVIHHGGEEAGTTSPENALQYLAVVLNHALNPENTETDSFTINYHFAIGIDGGLYEGRPIGIRGSHVSKHNSGRLGVLFMGNYSTITDQEAGWVNNQIKGTTILLNALKADGYNFYNLVVHGDFGGTDCPGQAFIDGKYIEKLRKETGITGVSVLP
jgi:hypothetical protein